MAIPTANSPDQSPNFHSLLYGESAMKSSRRIFTGTLGCRLLASCALLVLAVSTTRAQQINGTPGSPSATTTFDGKYLPPPPSKFGGEINLQASQSKPYWPPQVVPPQGAPNILLIMTDDQGYGAVLADAGGDYHRSQSSLGGIRHHLRTPSLR